MRWAFSFFFGEGGFGKVALRCKPALIPVDNNRLLRSFGHKPRYRLSILHNQDGLPGPYNLIHNLKTFRLELYCPDFPDLHKRILNRRIHCT